MIMVKLHFLTGAEFFVSVEHVRAVWEEDGRCFISLGDADAAYVVRENVEEVLMTVCGYKP